MGLFAQLPRAWEFFRDHQARFITLLIDHMELVLISEFLAIAVAVPLGIFAARNDRYRGIILGFGNVAQTIPTLAIIALAFPLLGIGFLPSLVGLFFYAILPILTNTIAGIDGVDENTVEAARGMGMTDNEVLKKIQLPLAAPVIFAGIRTSAVINVGTAYLAYFIGGGGLGFWVISGIKLYNMPMVLAGAIPGALLAITMDTLFAGIQRQLGGDALQSESTATA